MLELTLMRLFLLSSQVGTLTNEGGRLKRNPPLMQGKDYEIIPEPVWKALSQWYAGGPSLPRNVSLSSVFVDSYSHFFIVY